MCDFGISTLAVASLATSALSAGVGAIGAIQQGQAAAAAARQQSAAAAYQAQVARNQQQVLEWQARDAEARGSEEERQRRVKTRLQIGAQRAAMASQGVDLGEGSPLDIVGDTAAVGEQDALSIRSNARREAWDFRLRGTNAGADAAMGDFSSRALARRAASYESASWLGVGANLISGASTVSDRWSMYKTRGVWG